MDFLSKFSKETHWNSIETQFLPNIENILIFKMIFLHDKIDIFLFSKWFLK